MQAVQDGGVCASEGAVHRGGVRRGERDVLPGGGADMSEFPERLRKLPEFLADHETNISSKVYNAILLAVELIEARERVTYLMEELT